MNARELSALFNRTFGFKEWPETFEVDAETYGNVCQWLFDSALELQFPGTNTNHFHLSISVGKNNGLLFKGVELLIKGRNDAGNTKNR